MVLSIKLGQLVEEAGGDAVLVVKVDGAGDGGISDDIAVSQVLCDDARTWLLLLCDVVAIAVGVGHGYAVVAGRLVGGQACVRSHGNVGGAELGVIKEEGGLGGGVLLKGHGSGLGLALGLDVETGNLAAGGEELKLVRCDKV